MKLLRTKTLLGAAALAMIASGCEISVPAKDGSPASNEVTTPAGGTAQADTPAPEAANVVRSGAPADPSPTAAAAPSVDGTVKPLAVGPKGPLATSADPAPSPTTTPTTQPTSAAGPSPRIRCGSRFPPCPSGMKCDKQPAGMCVPQ